MSTVRCTVHCTEEAGDAPALAHAVMGNMAYNLLRTGVRLQRTLEGLCEAPLLRRTMSMLNDGIGIDKATGVYGEGTCDFTLMDQIMDVIVGPRSIPFFGLCFMPKGLSAAGQPPAPGTKDADLPPEAKLAEPWMKADRFPPSDYGRWYDLVRAVVGHAVERYGEEVVSRWYWDFWNEPDLRFYWLATPEEFLKTYDYAAAAVKDALPSAKVGGCGPADPRHPIFKQFLEHCTAGGNYCTGGTGAPLDFITFHMKGGPTGKIGEFPNPWEATDYPRRSPSLCHIIDATRRAMRDIASVPGTEGLPVFLTECDIDWGTGTSIYHNPNMHYRNSEYFAAFECALTRRMLDVHAEFPANPIEATFLDTFYFPGFRFFEGQRTLITGEAVDKPILNALRLLGRLGGRRLAVEEPDAAPVEVLATTAADGRICVMAVNFAEDLAYADSHEVEVALAGLPAGSRHCRHWRIDRDHSNAYTAWLAMGRPPAPDDAQLAELQARQGLELMEPERDLTGEGGVVMRTVLPPQAVSLWELAPA